MFRVFQLFCVGALSSASRAPLPPRSLPLHWHRYGGQRYGADAGLSAVVSSSAVAAAASDPQPLRRLRLAAVAGDLKADVLDFSGVQLDSDEAEEEARAMKTPPDMQAVGDGESLAALEKQREAAKHPDSHSCSCKAAKMAKKFSSQLGVTLAQLKTCRTSGGGGGGGGGAAAASGSASLAGRLASIAVKDGATADDGKADCAVAKRCSVLGLGSDPKVALTYEAGDRATFTIKARDSAGNPCPGNDPFFWARLEGFAPEMAGGEKPAAFVDVNIDALAPGLFRASFYVMFPGKYNLVVTFEGKPLPGTPRQVEVSGPPPPAVARHPLPLCRSLSTQFGHGRWATPTTWQPYFCTLGARAMSTDTACLRDQHLLFVGDSLLRCEFWNMGHWVTQDKGGTLFEPTLKSGETMQVLKNKQLSHFDGWLTHYLTVVPALNYSQVYRTAWTTTLTDAFPQTGEGSGYADGSIAKRNSARPYLGFGSDDTAHVNEDDPKNKPILDEVRAKFGLAGEEHVVQAIMKQTTVLLLGVASHDMVANDLKSFRQNLRIIFGAIRNKWAFAGKLIWVTSTPPVPQKQAAAFAHYKWLQTFTKNKVYNDVIKQEVAQWGGVVIDAAAVAWARPELSYDGQHYVSGGHALKDPVYNAIRQAIVHEVCYNSDENAGAGPATTVAAKSDHGI